VAPFHWWAPDAYEGSEPWTLAFVSVIPKVAISLVMLRLVYTVSAHLPLLSMLVVLMAILSLVIGSFAALKKNDIRRMMAYSGIVNGGYVLIALTVIAERGAYTTDAFHAAIFFILSYALATMGVLLIAAHEGGKVSDLNGLSQRNPFMAWSLAILVFSMIGVPPLIGFFAKLNLLLVAVAAGHLMLAVLAVIVAVVSAFYYLRLLRAAFFAEVTVQDGELSELDEVSESNDEGEVESAVKAEVEIETRVETKTLSAVERADITEKSPYSAASDLAIACIVLAVVIMGIFYQPIMNFLTVG
jgi:NADH-quinone oxidoreductase subunit N